jgi:[ribosomal protein S18]-alanine N-acetyltransferase
MTEIEKNSAYQIRAMHSGDLAQVQFIDRNSFSLPWPTSAYNYELTNPQSLLWVAEILGEENTPKIVGMIVMWLIVDEAHIATLAVEPDYRRQGIARNLLAMALRVAVHTGMKEATLEVRANNLAAQQLYRKFMFEIAGFRPHYYRDNSEDALIMTMKNLGESYLDWLDSMVWNNSSKINPATQPASASSQNQ